MRLLLKALVEQLAQHLHSIDATAQRAEIDALDAAKNLATDSEKKEDARAALEFGSLATGQGARARAVQQDVHALNQFYTRGLPRYDDTSPVGLGAIVDVALEGGNGNEERTYVLLPVGAGTELTGPDGDGYLTVITPASPVGRALLGRRVGESVDVTVRGEITEWSITGIA